MKKTHGQIFGAELTKAEQKALDIEIHRQLAIADRKNANEIDAIILWWLHEKLGFGPKRLKEFYTEFHVAYEQLMAAYEFGGGEMPWLCTEKLKEIGVNLEDWVAENEQNERKNGG